MQLTKVAVYWCIFYFVTSQTINTVTNPDGSCTNPIIWKFDTMEEYNQFISTDTSHDNNTVALRYNISTENNALCLDGSNGVFYYRTGFGDGKTKYLIFMEGGGGCGDINSCAYRARNYLGSTINDTKYAWFSSEFLASNPDTNPLIHNWNVIFLRYCDGASFSGNNASATYINNGTEQIYFRGYHILKNALTYIWNNLGLSYATDVILSGCSAGGIAAYYHADFVLNNFIPPGAKYMVMPESGLFLQGNDDTGAIARFNMHNMTIGMNQECILQYNKQNQYLCSYTQYTMPYIKSKAFALQSKFDMAAMNGQSDAWKSNYTVVNEWGNNVTQHLMNDFINGGKYYMSHGAFFDSCSHHCGEFNHIEIDGYLSSQAMYEWYYNSEENHNRLYIQNVSYPCDKCCFPPNDISNAPLCNDPHN